MQQLGKCSTILDASIVSRYFEHYIFGAPKNLDEIIPALNTTFCDWIHYVLGRHESYMVTAGNTFNDFMTLYLENANAYEDVPRPVFIGAHRYSANAPREDMLKVGETVTGYNKAMDIINRFNLCSESDVVKHHAEYVRLNGGWETAIARYRIVGGVLDHDISITRIDDLE